MEFQYEKEMQKHGLKYADLPEDAQTGIDQIKDVNKALNMLEKSGKNQLLRRLKKSRQWISGFVMKFTTI